MTRLQSRLIGIILKVIIPIIIGIIIYILFRVNSHIGLSISTSGKYICPPDWVKFNLPDGLWLFALLSAITIVWDDERSLAFLLWVYISIALALMSEILQLYRLIPGTFDALDLLAYSIAVAVHSINNKIKHLKNF